MKFQPTLESLSDKILPSVPYPFVQPEYMEINTGDYVTYELPYTPDPLTDLLLTNFEAVQDTFYGPDINMNVPDFFVQPPINPW